MEFIVHIKVGKVVDVTSSERESIGCLRCYGVLAKSSAQLLSKGVRSPVVVAVAVLITQYSPCFCQ